MTDESRLVTASQRGDVTAFGELIERHHNLVCAIAYSRTGDRVASEDIAQETFLAAWRQLGELREPEKLRGWLCSIARNLASKSLRARRASDDIADHEIAGDASPLDALLTKEMETTVWSALEQLPATYREPLVLFYREDQSIKEVALGLGLSEETAKQRLSRGREQLRENVGELIEKTLSAGRPRKAAAAAVLAAIIASGTKPAMAAAHAGAKVSRWKPVAGVAAACGVVALVGLGISQLAGSRTPSDKPVDKSETLARLRQAHDAINANGASTTCQLTGSIVDAHGARVAGALVAIFENAWEATSFEPHFIEPSGGTWQRDVRAGVYTVTVSAPGLRAQTRMVTCDAKRDVALTLSAGGAVLRGSVSDVGGGPIATATIFLIDLSRPTEVFVTRSRADGEYEITVEPGLYNGMILHPDYTLEARPFTLGASSVREDVTMLPGGSIEGTFVDAKGAPIVGARISTIAPATDQLGDQPTRWQLATAYAAMLPTVTDASGKFVLRSLPPGKLRVIARSPALATSSPVEVELSLAENKPGLVLTGERARSIAGFIVAGDRSVANVQVVAIREGELIAMPIIATTDRGGHFDITGLVPGKYRVAAIGAGLVPHFGEQPLDVSTSDQRDELITLERGVTIRGSIDSGARAHVKLALAKPTSPTSMVRAMMTRADVDANGNFTIAGVLPGDYLVTATTFDRRGEASVNIKAMTPSALRIVTKPRPAIAGEVVDDSGKKLAGVLVQARPRRSADPFAVMFTTVRTDEQGAFRIVGVSPGEHALRVFDVRGQRPWAHERKRPFRAKEIEVPLTGAATTTLTVVAGGSRLTGVITANGQPMTDAWIEVRPEDARGVPEAFPSPPVLTDAKGLFSIDGLFGDEFVVDAASPDGKLRAAARVKSRTHVALELKPVATIAGKVTFAGVTVPAFDVKLRHAATGDFRIANGRAGQFSVEAIAGEHELVITCDAGYAKRTLTAGSPTNIDVELTAWSSLKGRVIDADGNPWANAKLLVHEHVEATLAKTDADGRFSLDRMIAGKNELSIIHDLNALELTRFHFELAPGQILDAGTIDGSAMFTTKATSSTDLGLRFALDATKVLIIAGVTPNGPGARAGLRKGDQIVEVGMTHVGGGKSAVDMMMSLSTPWRSKGRPVTWTVVRDGRPLELDVLVPK